MACILGILPEIGRHHQGSPKRDNGERGAADDQINEGRPRGCRYGRPPMMGARAPWGIMDEVEAAGSEAKNTDNQNQCRETETVRVWRAADDGGNSALGHRGRSGSRR